MPCVARFVLSNPGSVNVRRRTSHSRACARSCASPLPLRRRRVGCRLLLLFLPSRAQHSCRPALESRPCQRPMAPLLRAGLRVHNSIVSRHPEAVSLKAPSPAQLEIGFRLPFVPPRRAHTVRVLSTPPLAGAACQGDQVNSKSPHPDCMRLANFLAGELCVGASRRPLPRDDFRCCRWA